MQQTGTSISPEITTLDTTLTPTTRLIEEISLGLDSSKPCEGTWCLLTEPHFATDMRLTMHWESIPLSSLILTSSFALLTKTFCNSKENIITLSEENLSRLVDSEACEHFMNSYWSEMHRTTFADVPESVKQKLQSFLKAATTNIASSNVAGELLKELELPKVSLSVTPVSCT